MKEQVENLRGRIIEYKENLEIIKNFENIVINNNIVEVFENYIKHSYIYDYMILIDEYLYLMEKKMECIEILEKFFCENVLKRDYIDMATMYLDITDEEYKLYKMSEEGKLVKLLEDEDLHSFEPRINKELINLI